MADRDTHRETSRFVAGRGPFSAPLWIAMGLLAVAAGGLDSRAFAAAPAEPAPGAETVGEDGCIELPTDESLKRQSDINGMLREGRFGPGQQAVFDDFYTKYFFPSWTLYRERGSLASFREVLSRSLRNGSGAVRDHLSALALSQMEAYAKRAGFRIVTRVNAALMIGELNATEARSGGEEVPLPAAVPILVGIAGDLQQPDAVRVAAMVGILRHLKFGGVQTPDARAAVANLAMALAARPAAGESDDAHAWIQKQAADVLGALRAAGDNGVVATTLAAMVADAASPFYTRCSAAEALGMLDYAGASGLDFRKLAIPLGQLAVDAFVAESKAQAEAQAAAQVAAAGPAAPQVAPAAGNAAVPIVQRGRLKSRINAAASGLDRIAGAAKGTPAESLITSMQKPLQAVLVQFEEVRTDDPTDLKAMMAAMAPEIEKLRLLLATPAG